MLRKIKASALAALCCTVVGAGIAGAQGASAAEWDPFATTKAADWDPFASTMRKADADLISGTKKIKVAGRSVNVSCSGSPSKGEPVIMLMHGG
ncbi:alpha/beta hydrolase, partial [Nonomuraea sp. K274]|nr:alpha/beta hydrolase [Nonomuraea cypriaca]